MTYHEIIRVEPAMSDGNYEIPEGNVCYRIPASVFEHLKKCCRIKKSIQVSNWYDALSRETQQTIGISIEES
jgi:hypothetical protein